VELSAVLIALHRSQAIVRAYSQAIVRADSQAIVRAYSQAIVRAYSQAKICAYCVAVKVTNLIIYAHHGHGIYYPFDFI
jgi:ribonuclease HI